MMALLRSRTTMFVLVGVVTIGLVATMAVGLFNAMSAPTPPAGEQAEPPPPAPDMASLGQPPDGVEYTDLGEQCNAAECYRPVAVTAEDLDAEGAIEAVYGHLLDQGWGRLLPQGEDDPDEVPLAESALADGSVMVQGSTQPYTEESTAGLVLAHSTAPTPAS
ncbi:hypothetical protein HDA32_000102 [Spinactinospora alkalitolerans]|uniref:Uncharacterized protein n=1 Tax=Spinactinospora alkalitolerans TaxID=687207 RepID=A0A852TQ79_9ACTN|nr:hypothetical protein [Spinactinospora alkalitolerans]NYE44982.1 hypothetical protein [Spinactinospora alkalitolerans]